MDSALITFFANAGIAGVVIIAIIAGWLVPKPAYKRVLKESARKDEVIEKLQEALVLERQRSNDTTQAGAVTIQLVKGLVKLASERHDDHAPAVDGTRPSLDLTAGDLGL